MNSQRLLSHALFGKRRRSMFTLVELTEASTGGERIENVLMLSKLIKMDTLSLLFA